MEDFIKSKLRENLNTLNKWDLLEQDVTNAITPIIEKYQKSFGNDSYAVIDAITQIFDGMFETVNR